PGKFSTMLVVVSNPPGMVPVSTSGLRLARAAYNAAVNPAQPVPMMTTFSIERAKGRGWRESWQGSVPLRAFRCATKRAQGKMTHQPLALSGNDLIKPLILSHGLGSMPAVQAPEEEPEEKRAAAVHAQGVAEFVKAAGVVGGVDGHVATQKQVG